MLDGFRRRFLRKKQLAALGTLVPGFSRARHRRLSFETLEDRRMLSFGSYPDLPGLQLVDSQPDQFAGQTVYLDFDGAENITYNGPTVIQNIDIPAFKAPGQRAGQEQPIIANVVAQLEATFAGTGISFTTERPADDTPYSTVILGGNGFASGEGGPFLGLAEQADIGNKNREDSAFVFSDLVFAGQGDVTLLDVTVHEIGHLLGYVHSQEAPSGRGSDLAAVAYGTGVHAIISEEAGDLYGALFGISGVTLEYQTYLSQPTTGSSNTGNSVTEGVVEEDDGTRSVTHFSAGGDGSELTDGLLFFNSAFETVSDRYPNAVSNFNSGDTASAYYWLGRAMHFFQDATVPAHVNNDQHLIGDDEYEAQAGNLTSFFDFDVAQYGSSWNFQTWGGDWSSPEALWDRSDDYGSLEAIFRETTDYTDDYDSDNAAGDNGTSDAFPVARLAELDRVHHTAWALQVTGNGSDLNSSEVELLARDLGTWAVEQSAMLVRFFYEEVGEVLPAPSGIQIEGTSAGSVQLNWDDLSADGYVVYRSTDPESGFSRVGSTVNSSYDDTGLSESTTYYYRVFAYNETAGLGSGYSNITATTNPLTADFDADGDIDGFDFLTWQRGFGTQTGASLADGDADAEEDVDAIDLAVWESQFGQAALISASLFEEPVEEPERGIAEATVDAEVSVRPDSSWIFHAGFANRSLLATVVDSGVFSPSHESMPQDLPPTHGSVSIDASSTVAPLPKGSDSSSSLALGEEEACIGSCSFCQGCFVTN